ncbi:unnamed protein product [Cochlearia groenlandica]
MRRFENLNDRNSQKLVQFVAKDRVYEDNAMRFLMGEESHYSSPRVYNRFSAARSDYLPFVTWFPRSWNQVCLLGGI